MLYGEPRDVSRVRAIGCLAFVYLNVELLAKGKQTPKAWNTLYLDLTPNKSSFLFYIPEKNSVLTMNKVKLIEYVQSKVN